ncbi:MAG: hypothetical protein ACRCXC_08325 [Legionella sp.]
MNEVHYRVMDSEHFRSLGIDQNAKITWLKEAPNTPAFQGTLERYITRTQIKLLP